MHVRQHASSESMLPLTCHTNRLSHTAAIREDSALPAGITVQQIQAAQMVYVKSSSGAMVPVNVQTFLHYRSQPTTPVAEARRSTPSTPPRLALSTPVSPLDKFRRHIDGLKHDDPIMFATLLGDAEAFNDTARACIDQPDQPIPQTLARSLSSSPASFSADRTSPLHMAQVRGHRHRESGPVLFSDLSPATVTARAHVIRNLDALGVSN
ncbi:hypothetical protein J8273_4115 [Carpediemonas membranifera]|uniref:Uncharacterized protein n=1 Tax=Carpediemonas membranifera TaxID=201153 RepID=A0A8J6EAB1_9EUKA|nr:hypothetical protein J8273_4115 [Carpediemonas membranifera]|eukprot:KAG9394450.1 hypothetical protein J8273_4115 [Carpediemonas membranifera]